MDQSFSPPARKAGTNASSGARFRAMLMATSVRSRRPILSKPRHGIRDGTTFGNHNVCQQVPAIWSWRNLVDEDFVTLQLRIAACERYVEGALDLATKLLCLPHYLAVELMISLGYCPEVLRRTPDQRTPPLDYDAFATSQTSPLSRIGATCRPTYVRRCGFNSWVEIGSQPGRLD